MLGKNIFSIDELFNFGLHNLPKDNSRPDKNLASVFLAISSLKSISKNDASIAIDAMVYCENEDNDLGIMTCAQISEAIKKITPFV